MIGERFKQLRQQRALRQADLLPLLGITQGTLSKIESGLRLPSLRVVERAAAAFGVTVADLLAQLPPLPPHPPNS